MIGGEATRRIKADPATQNIPVIALTGHAMVGDNEKAMDVGCEDDDNILFDFPCLLSKIESLIGN